MRVLNNEKVEADGLQIVGVPYRNAARRSHLESTLKKSNSIAIAPAFCWSMRPTIPAVAEAAGVSLQLSGHTHLGQFIPWSWFARESTANLSTA